MKSRLLFALAALALGSGCATGSVRLGRDPQAPQAQQTVVDQLLCEGRGPDLDDYFIARRISISASRFLMLWRLSAVRLPFTKAISTLMRP